MDELTIEQGKQHIRENMNEGTHCSCCSQYVKMYKRKISGLMAHILVLMYNHSKTDFMHVWDTLKHEQLQLTGDVAKLKYWGLIEQREGKREDGSSNNGFWRVTDRGRRFVENRLTVPEYALVFNGKCYGLQGEQIGIFETFGQKFNYTELMTDYGTPTESIEKQLKFF